MKAKLVVKNGFGKVENEKGIFSVLQAGGLWNLYRQPKGEYHSFWVKENVKRLSTLQRFADQREYNIEIVQE